MSPVVPFNGGVHRIARQALMLTAIKGASSLYADPNHVGCTKKHLIMLLLVLELVVFTELLRCVCLFLAIV